MAYEVMADIRVFKLRRGQLLELNIGAEHTDP